MGFINPNGTNLAYLNIRFRLSLVDLMAGLGSMPIVFPVMTGDNSTIIFRKDFFPTYPAEIVVVHPGNYPVICSDWGWRQFGRPQLTLDQTHLLVEIEDGLALFDLDSCNQNSTPDQVFELPEDAILSPNNQFVVYRRFTEIVTRNIASTEEYYITSIGDNLAWSRDSEWLAYTGYDGIYIIRRDGSESHRLVELKYLSDSNSPAYEGDPSYFAPWASWSSDGKWLVYHRCLGSRTVEHTCSWEDQAIFKVSVESGEEIKLVDNGIYPYWRWP